MTRQFWVLIHRYVGLAMTVFLIIVGLTGSVLAFKDDLDLWLNPDLLRAPVRTAPMLDPLVLREKAEGSMPGMRADQVALHIEPGRSFEAGLTPQVKSAAVKEFVTLPGLLTVFSDEAGAPYVYLDPYTGKVLGERNITKGLHGRKDIIWFLYRLHMTLALPEKYAGLGARILGVVALLWTVDCLVSFYLTLPKRRKQSPTLVERVVKAFSKVPTGHKVEGLGKGKLEGNCMIDPPHPSLSTASSIPASTLPPSLAVVPQGRKGKSWWQRWQPAWKIKFSAGATRINFDIHRAFGLWTWVMLFILAWSSVAFNLDEVYTPVMNTLFGAPIEPEQQSSATPEPPTRPPLTGEPKLDWYPARNRGRELLAEKAQKEDFAFKKETFLILTRDTGQYTFCADTLAKSEDSQVCVDFDADTGLPPPEPPLPTSTANQENRLTDTITWWITFIHLARVFGLPMKIIICLMGLVITALSVTGVVIWWRKRRRAKTKQIKMASAANLHELNN